MSRFAVVPAVVFDAGLDAPYIALYAALALHADKSGHCFPSHETLAKLCGRSIGWVSGGIKAIEEAGLLSKRYYANKKLKYWIKTDFPDVEVSIQETEDTIQPSEERLQPTENRLQPAETNNTNITTPINNTKEHNPPIVPPCDEAVEAFNEMARETGLATVQKLTTKRRKALHKRLEDAGGMDGWRHAMDLIRRSDFLRGENSRGWRATFDFILREDKFTSLMEGAYNRNEQESTRNIFDRVYAELGVSRD